MKALQMSFTLKQIPLDELRELAHSRVPGTLGRRFASDALPPSFVAQRGVQQIDAGASELWCATFYVVRGRDDTIVGACGFKHPPRDGMVEIGYGISAEARNEGAATSAVRQLLDIAFGAGAQAVLAEVTPDNVASTSVIEKFDFRNIGSRLDEDGDQVIRWLARRDTAASA